MSRIPVVALCLAMIASVPGNLAAQQTVSIRITDQTTVSEHVLDPQGHPVATRDKAYPSQLSGTVVDTSGAVIAGATVQVRSANGTVQERPSRTGTAPSLFLDSRQAIIDSWYRIPVLKPRKSLSPLGPPGRRPRCASLW